VGHVYFYEDPNFPETSWSTGQRAGVLSSLNRLATTGALADLPNAGQLAHPLEFHLNPNLAEYSYMRGLVGGRWQIDLHPDVFRSQGLRTLSIGHEIGHVFGEQAGFPDKSLEERNIRAWEMNWGERLGARPEVLQNSREWFVRCLQPCL
jgi:hypothetical protein